MPLAEVRRWRDSRHPRPETDHLGLRPFGALGGIGVGRPRLPPQFLQPSAGTGYELDTIAAVVIGGASLNGGVGRNPGNRRRAF